MRNYILKYELDKKCIYLQHFCETIFHELTKSELYIIYSSPNFNKNLNKVLMKSKASSCHAKRHADMGFTATGGYYFIKQY
jgi:hypothetical protein